MCESARRDEFRSGVLGRDRACWDKGFGVVGGGAGALVGVVSGGVRSGLTWLGRSGFRELSGGDLRAARGLFEGS